MVNECRKFAKCSFLEKYKDDPAVDCQHFVDVYCKGPRMKECKRMEFLLTHCRQASEDLSPDGVLLS